eukprot:scaffold15373_cov115-Isochrysis_galbana.AAC.2
MSSEQIRHPQQLGSGLSGSLLIRQPLGRQRLRRGVALRSGELQGAAGVVQLGSALRAMVAAHRLRKVWDGRDYHRPARAIFELRAQH